MNKSKIFLPMNYIFYITLNVMYSYYKFFIPFDLLTSLLFHCRLPDAQCKREGSQLQTKKINFIFVLVSLKLICLYVNGKLLHDICPSVDVA